ncbi:MAG: hypothetical protein GY857_13650, partial [Desulfobacula sp.]|nr:hypothetical protein [Desulfobacula sp.]
MLHNACEIFDQIPLIHIVDEDDQILLHSQDAEWFKILYYFKWSDYCEIGAKYYDALYHHNILEKLKRNEKSMQEKESCSESKEEAKQRLLFDRPTIDHSLPVIHEEQFKTVLFPTVSPSSIAPGIVPERFGGKKPKCFFSLFQAFLGANLMGFPAEPEKVHLLLTSNLPFARVCGFVPKGENTPYWRLHVPSLRKLEQFDMIMTRYGLWNEIKWEEVSRNIEEGVIKKENEVVGD